MRRQRIVLPLCVATLTACASHPPQSPGGGACRVTETDAVALETYEHDLPKPDSRALGHDDFYPPQGKREHLQGRVLARFHIDSAGKTASPEFLRVDAPPVIVDAACKLLHRVKFDVSQPGVDTGSAGTYLLTVRFCLTNCDQVPLYPGTRDVTITASVIPYPGVAPPDKSD